MKQVGRITDSQVHLITPPSTERPWPSGAARYAHDVDRFSAEDLIKEMDRAGVDRAVLVPPSFEGDRNDVCLEAASSFPRRFAVMGRVSLADESQREQLEGWKELPGMLGVRVTFSQGASKSWLDDGTSDWFWPVAEQLDLPVMIFAPGRADAISLIARQHPRLRLMVDHAGIPTDRRDQEIDRFIDDLLSLRAFPNVAVKLSSLPAFVREAYPFPSLRGRLLRIIDTFGVDRCAWGSDLTRLPCSYRESLDFFIEFTRELTTNDRRRLLDSTVSTWLRWP